MPFARIVGVIVGAVLAAAVLAGPVAAVDLDDARTKAAILEEALARGAKDDWRGAEAVARKTSDVLVHDIVLWRKLRAGAGTVKEYQSFVSRRGTFPGMDILAQVVLGRDVAGRSERGLSGQAEANWKALSRLWMKDSFDEAERKIVAISTSAAALGVPERWADRRAKLARRAAREGRGELAYRIASQHFLTSEAGYDYAELEWIAGWVALRRLNKPDLAISHFQRFQLNVETPISLSRGGYWLGRAYEAKSDAEAARRFYAIAARHQTAFYGQLAAEKIGAGPDATIVSNDLAYHSGAGGLQHDDFRAMVILHYAGEEDLAFQMFIHKSKTLASEQDYKALGKLALDIGKPHYAVRIGKNAARRGYVIPAAYYPVTELARYATKIEPAMAMAIARQETELNPLAVSRAGARGLMQLMPATAKVVARTLGEPYSAIRLTQDWRYNARLGQTYLAQQVNRFDGSYFMAAAAYNAGPHRVSQWIAEYGDPRRPGADIIDWIEHIPFNETRNYVHRVMESLWTYRSRLSGTVQPLSLSRDLTRGIGS